MRYRLKQKMKRDRRTGLIPFDEEVSRRLYKNQCELCDEKCVDTEKHHLVPLNRGRIDSHDLVFRNKASLCHKCHVQIHRMITNDELEDKFWTIELLKENADIQRWLEWKRHCG